MPEFYGSTFAIDPIFYHPGLKIYEDGTEEPEGWYFWTETWAHYEGPFNTRSEAVKNLLDYCKNL